MAMKNLVTALLVCMLGLSWSQDIIVSFTPETAVLFPGGNVTFSCNITIGRFWIINVTTTRVASGELPDGLMADGNMLIITESANDTLYGCGVIVDPNVFIDTGIVYLAAVPDIVPGVMVDISSISSTPQFPAQPTQFSFTLNWGEPFANFDPILNYTIITSCSDNTVCPVTHVTGSDVTTLDISYTLPIITVNYTISITANNTVGLSDPVMRILTAPNQIQNVSVMCAPVDVDNECTVAWNDLAYGPNAVPLSILYLVSYSGINITTDSSTVMSSPHVFTLPPVDGSVFVSVQAYNDFGSGGTSLGVEDTIMAPVVEATMSMVLEGDTPAETYSVEVECDIRPSSTADYCEVIARNDDSTVSASATIMDGMATVTVTGLVCEETYSIVAGGIITNDVMMDRTLDGPRVYTGTILAAACPAVVTTRTVTTDETCEETIDNTWCINWPETIAGFLSSQTCPAGLAYRRCHQNGEWDDFINVTQCRKTELTNLTETVDILEDNLVSESNIDVANKLQVISGDLVDITTRYSGKLFPNDLNSTIGIIDTIIRIIASVNTTENDTVKVVDMILNDVATTISNLLNDSNRESFLQSSNMGLPTIGEDLLRSTENLVVAVGNVTSATNENRTIPNENLLVEAQLVEDDTSMISMIVFPNDTTATMFSGTQITIPRNALIHQRETENLVVPVMSFVANNLQLYISDPSLSVQFPTYGPSSSGVVISTQFSQGPINLTQDDRHVILIFNLGTTGVTRCVFWDFNISTLSNDDAGGWSSDGIIQDNNPSPPVICRVTHLTSFSVLVSSMNEDAIELHIVSYIGCAVSIVCLLLTIGAIIWLRKTTFKAKHNKIHLNLSIALLLALVTFVSGAETAVDSEVACIIVTVLLHYFFLAVFCWMLCEGIIMLVMFVKVIYHGFFQRMYFFLFLGWGLPLPIVVISAAVSFDNYGVEGPDGTRTVCWISDDDGAIWAFTAPMIVIIGINIIIMIIALVRICQSKKLHAAITDPKKKAILSSARVLLLSVLALLPLLGGTWILGLLFLIDNEQSSITLAWVFTIVNSLQGAAIFFFHVVRNKEVKIAIEERYEKWKKDRKWKKTTTLQMQALGSNFALQSKSNTSATST
ncbi:adhesion G protein-coupled receptor L3-like isoform X2 [Dysidea avara]|uniref:adhesion G protein-coupled receptor L3-like isoform X2 n=1 Tax=Dysidea avara TaxID=196820 RepID=UPI00332CCB5E